MSGAIELDIKAKLLKYIKTIKTVEIKLCSNRHGRKI